MISEQTKINQQFRFQFVLTDSHSRLVGIFKKLNFYQNIKMKMNQISMEHG